MGQAAASADAMRWLGEQRTSELSIPCPRYAFLNRPHFAAYAMPSAPAASPFTLSP